MSLQFGLRRNRQTLAILAIIATFSVTLTLHAALSRFNLDEWGDMAENYAWGVLWQWGYSKHPPLFGWLTAAWFSVMPNTDLFYYVFSSLNVAVALLCLWRIAARYGDGNYQLFVVILAVLIPPFSFQAIKYNANSAMTPIWAAAFLFYLRGLERQRVIDALMLGLLAGAAMLAKYYSVILVLTLLVHALLDPRARLILFSRFGLVTLVSSLAAFAGHLLWLLGNDFMPVTYAAHQGDGAFVDFVASLLFYLAGTAVYLLPALGLAIIMRSPKDGYPLIWSRRLGGLRQTIEGRALLAFAVLPTILTVLLGLAAGAELSIVWALPLFTPLVLVVGLLLPPDLLARHMRRALVIVTIYGVALLVSAPIYRESVRGGDRFNLTVPLAAMSAALDRYWEQDGGGGRGPVIAGEPVLANAMSFYSRHDAIILEENSLDVARDYLPVSEVDRRGMIVICRAVDVSCAELGKSLLAGRQAVAHAFDITGFDGERQWGFATWIAPPRR